jgi:hypothetical protein
MPSSPFTVVALVTKTTARYAFHTNRAVWNERLEEGVYSAPPMELAVHGVRKAKVDWRLRRESLR